IRRISALVQCVAELLVYLGGRGFDRQRFTIARDRAVAVAFACQHVPEIEQELGGARNGGYRAAQRLLGLVAIAAIEKHRDELTVRELEIGLQAHGLRETINRLARIVLLFRDRPENVMSVRDGRVERERPQQILLRVGKLLLLAQREAKGDMSVDVVR